MSRPLRIDERALVALLGSRVLLDLEEEPGAEVALVPLGVTVRGLLHSIEIDPEGDALMVRLVGVRWLTEGEST